jgi:hypothetical protein
MQKKKTVKSAVSFGTFGTYEHKSCTENVGEIDNRGLSKVVERTFAQKSKQKDEEKLSKP